MGNPAARATMPISPDKRRHAKGAALIEVLVAVAITVMIGTMAFLTFGGNDRRVVALAAAETAIFLQEARARAQETGRPIEIVVNNDAGLIDAGGIQHRFARDIAITPEEATLILYPTGQSDGLTLTLSKGTQSRTVVLDWLLGQVSVP